MSRPPPFPAIKKEDDSFNRFIENLLFSLVDMHRVNGEFQLVSAPDTSSDAGTQGMFSYDSSYLYVCVEQDTWKRITLSTW